MQLQLLQKSLTPNSFYVGTWRGCRVGSDPRDCESERSIRSIESQASRCHVSLKVQRVCPDCGVVGIRLNRQTGLCPACTERMHLAEEVAFNEILRREAEEKAGDAEVTAIRRERDRMRKRNSRLCRKHGLKTRRERRNK